MFDFWFCFESLYLYGVGWLVYELGVVMGLIKKYILFYLGIKRILENLFENDSLIIYLNLKNWI